MSNIHISLDDVKGIFKFLVSNSPKSIFETRTLSFLKKMNCTYGTKFDLYCTCSDGTYSLENVPDTYKNEFANNSEWLRFGFHCYRERGCEDYTDKEFIHQYNDFEKQIVRVTGSSRQTDILRIHAFELNREMCIFLKEKGINTLLTADDERRSYYLNQENVDKLKREYVYDDLSTHIKFLRSCTRLEKNTDIVREITEYQQKAVDVIPVFTHEWMMDNDDVREKMELCCKLKEKLDDRNFCDHTGI